MVEAGVVQVSRRRLCLGGLVAFAVVATGSAACGSDGGEDESAPTTGGGKTGGGDAGSPVLYSSPTCGCCSGYADHLRDNGYDVTVEHPDDLDKVKADAGVPKDAEACHTTVLDGYVIEGHVPLEAVDKLLNERPDIVGIALPGMPTGTPGMDGPKEGPFEILAIKEGSTEPYLSL